MDKSPDAFRTISEAAEELDLPQHVLRFWETRFLQIKPLKRGGGRRYYRPDDVQLLKGIRHLLYDQGFTIKGVQRILKDQGTRHVAAIGETGRIHPIAPAPPEGADAGEPLSETSRDDAPRREPEVGTASFESLGPVEQTGTGDEGARAGSESDSQKLAVQELREAQRAELRSLIETLEACRATLDRARGV